MTHLGSDSSLCAARSFREINGKLTLSSFFLNYLAALHYLMSVTTLLHTFFIVYAYHHR